MPITQIKIKKIRKRWYEILLPVLEYSHVLVSARISTPTAPVRGPRAIANQQSAFSTHTYLFG